MNAQFMAYSSSTATFGLRTQDAAGYRKEFRFNPTTAPANDYLMQIVHYFDLAPVDRISTPADVVLTAFTGANGDWTDAAEDYKKWAYDQPFVQQAASRSTPDWLANVGASKLLVGTGSDTLVPQTYQQNVALLAQDQQILGRSMLGLIFGWEKYGSWYAGDYFPPQEGWNAFDAAIQSGKQQAQRWWVFPSPNYLSMPTDLWKSGGLQSRRCSATEQQVSICCAGKEFANPARRNGKLCRAVGMVPDHHGRLRPGFSDLRGNSGLRQRKSFVQAEYSPPDSSDRLAGSPV